MYRITISSLLLLAVFAATPASAGERADFAWGFAEQRPAADTKWTLHLRYKAPGDPEAKPYAIRQLSLRPPVGTRFHHDTFPACEATNEQIQLLGDAACPPESRVGTGVLTVMTGFGPPLDPYPTDLSLFSYRDGLIEVLKDQSLGNVFAIERLKVQDGALNATPVVVPGGPPDFKIAARDIDWDMTSGWLTTPRTCPAGGLWTSSGTFTFDDGATVTETSTTPCTAPKRATTRKAKRCAKRSKAKRPRGCRRRG